MNKAKNNKKRTPCPVGEPGQEGYTECGELTGKILEVDMSKSIVCSLECPCPKACVTMGYALCTETEGKCEYQILIENDTSDSDEKFPYVIGEEAEILHNGEWKKGKIINGYRFRDGIVTIRTEDGETVWCGEARKDLYRPLI